MKEQINVLKKQIKESFFSLLTDFISAVIILIIESFVISKIWNYSLYDLYDLTFIKSLSLLIISRLILRTIKN
jgi:hypothetical protein